LLGFKHYQIILHPSTVTTPIPKRGIAITARVPHDSMHERNKLMILRKMEHLFRSLNTLHARSSLLTLNSQILFTHKSRPTRTITWYPNTENSNLTFQCTPHNALRRHAPRLQQAFLIQTLHQQKETSYDFVLSKFRPI
jgi:hypothetical protein